MKITEKEFGIIAIIVGVILLASYFCASQSFKKHSTIIERDTTDYTNYIIVDSNKFNEEYNQSRKALIDCQRVYDAQGVKTLKELANKMNEENKTNDERR